MKYKNEKKTKKNTSFFVMKTFSLFCYIDLTNCYQKKINQSLIFSLNIIIDDCSSSIKFNGD
jgi:hypothetical protein